VHLDGTPCCERPPVATGSMMAQTAISSTPLCRSARKEYREEAPAAILLPFPRAAADSPSFTAWGLGVPDRRVWCARPPIPRARFCSEVEASED
jgi:hypothetical protein